MGNSYNMFLVANKLVSAMKRATSFCKKPFLTKKEKLEHLLKRKGEINTTKAVKIFRDLYIERFYDVQEGKRPTLSYKYLLDLFTKIMQKEDKLNPERQFNKIEVLLNIYNLVSEKELKDKIGKEILRSSSSFEDAKEILIYKPLKEISIFGTLCAALIYFQRKEVFPLSILGIGIVFNRMRKLTERVERVEMQLKQTLEETKKGYMKREVESKKVIS